jgi:hypothetical protein
VGQTAGPDNMERIFDPSSYPSVVQPVASRYADHTIPVLRSEIHKPILFGIRKNCLISGKCLRIIVRIYKKGDKTDSSNYHGISLLSTSYKILSHVLSRLIPYIDKII